MWAEAQAASRAQFPWQGSPLTPHQDKPSPLPFRKDCHSPRREVGELWESPLSLLGRRCRLVLGGEAVAGCGVRMSVGGKKSALNGDSKEELGAGWERGGGLSRGGVFIFFFFLWLGEEKKNQNSNSIPAQINVCSKPSIKGEAGPGGFKGAERSGEEERVGRRVSGDDQAGERMPRQEKNGGSLPLR